MRGPDVLASDDLGLIAVFIEHASEVKDRRHLEARLILSNLGLPSHTRFVAVRRGGPLTNRDWDLVLETDDPRQISQALREVDQTRAPTPQEVRLAVWQRARSTSAIESVPVGEAGTDQGLDYRAAVRRRSIVSVSDGRLISDARGLSIKAANARLSDLVALSVPYEFAIDNGAIYPRARALTSHVLRVSPDISTSRVFDPYKVVRSAAFAGWALEGPPPETSMWDGLDVADWDIVSE